MNEFVLTFCRVFLFVVFLLSLIGKVRDIRAFAEAIRKFQILSSQFSMPTAVFFVVGELFVVLLLVVGGVFLLPGFMLAIAMLLVFTLALISVLNRGIVTNCNCFGANNQAISWSEVIRNAGLLLCALIGLIVSLEATFVNSLNFVETLLVGLAAIIFSFIWTNFGEIVRILH